MLAVLGALLSGGCRGTSGTMPSLLPLTCESPKTFADGKEPTSVRHVTTDGDDDAGDGSEGRPFRSVQRAVRDLTPGTAVEIHAGVYDGEVTLTAPHGTADAPIWIRGAVGEARPTIRNGNQGIYVTRPRYLVLEHLEIADTRDNGINVDDGELLENADAARFVVFKDLDIHDSGRQPSGIADCLKMAGVNDFFVINSRFRHCGRGPDGGAVGVGGVGTHHGVVSGGLFSDDGFGGVQFKGGASDIEVIGNRFENAGARGVNLGGATGRGAFRPPLTVEAPNHEAARIHVTANVFLGGESAAAFVGCVDCDFTRNTVAFPSRWALRILQETVAIEQYMFAPASKGVIFGNAFHFRRSDLNAGEDINIGGNTESASFTLDKNAWYAVDAPDRSRPVLPAFHGATLGQVTGVKPVFVNESGGDYRVPLTGETFPPGAPQSCAAPM